MMSVKSQAIQDTKEFPFTIIEKTESENIDKLSNEDVIIDMTYAEWYKKRRAMIK